MALISDNLLQLQARIEAVLTACQQDPMTRLSDPMSDDVEIAINNLRLFFVAAPGHTELPGAITKIIGTDDSVEVSTENTRFLLSITER